MSDYSGRLTIFSPFTYHAPALIIGDRDGLEGLRAALDLALLGQPREIAHPSYVFDAHGEGYCAVVAMVPTETASKGSAAYADEDSPPAYGPALDNCLRTAGIEQRFWDLAKDAEE